MLKVSVIAIATIFNIVALGYWSLIWIRSFQKHRDTASLLVMLFIGENFLDEIWFLILSSVLLLGQPEVEPFVFWGTVIDRLIVLSVLGTIHWLVRRMQRDEKEGRENG